MFTILQSKEKKIIQKWEGKKQQKITLFFNLYIEFLNRLGKFRLSYARLG